MGGDGYRCEYFIGGGFEMGIEMKLEMVSLSFAIWLPMYVCNV